MDRLIPRALYHTAVCDLSPRCTMTVPIAIRSDVHTKSMLPCIEICRTCHSSSAGCERYSSYSTVDIRFCAGCEALQEGRTMHSSTVRQVDPPVCGPDTHRRRTVPGPQTGFAKSLNRCRISKRASEHFCIVKKTHTSQMKPLDLRWL